MDSKLTLNDLPLNIKANILSVECKENLINRMYDFGIMKNGEITPIYRSPFGDPTAYLVKNAIVALRADDCKKITVTPIKS